MYHFVPLSYFMARHVHSNISKTDYGRCRLIGIEKCGTTELSAHACQKLRNTKGLCEIIVRARVKCFDLFFLTLSGRQNYDRYIRPGSQLPDESLSVAVGETEIESVPKTRLLQYNTRCNSMHYRNLAITDLIAKSPLFQCPARASRTFSLSC